MIIPIGLLVFLILYFTGVFKKKNSVQPSKVVKCDGCERIFEFTPISVNGGGLTHRLDYCSDDCFEKYHNLNVPNFIQNAHFRSVQQDIDNGVPLRENRVVGENKYMKCDGCPKKLEAGAEFVRIREPEYGYVFDYCSEQCFDNNHQRRISNLETIEVRTTPKPLPIKPGSVVTCDGCQSQMLEEGIRIYDMTLQLNLDYCGQPCVDRSYFNPSKIPTGESIYTVEFKEGGMDFKCKECKDKITTDFVKSIDEGEVSLFCSEYCQSTNLPMGKDQVIR